MPEETVPPAPEIPPVADNPDEPAVTPSADRQVPAVVVSETAVADAAAPAAAAVPELSPAACARALEKLFPALFGRQPKPLKLRIQADIQARAPGRFTKRVLSAFLHRYTGNTGYLIALTKATQRFDLDGQPAGEISEEHRQAAVEELARRRGSHDARRELEEEQRRNRAGLLHDYQITTLTRANFCALKGVAEAELDGLLEIARREAEERAQRAPVFDRDRRPPPGRRPDGPRRPDGRR